MRWIRISQRAPVHGDWVLIYNGQGHAWAERWGIKQHESRLLGFVTHWMPLPDIDDGIEKA